MSTWTCPSCAGENPPGMRFCGHCGSPAPTATPAPARDGPARGEEHRLVTAVFADLSGFTPLAQQLDTEALLEVIDPIVARMAAAVGRYEGFVEKFAGDAVLAIFGAPACHEDDAERALRVALEMREELAAATQDAGADGHDLTLHIGVNSGHGIARLLDAGSRMDYGVLGDVLILAQRLESAAPANEIYVSDSTYELTQRLFEFESVGELTLKGRTEAVRAWRLLGVRRGAGTTRRFGNDLGLVGRDDERRTMREALDGLDTGLGSVLTLAGEAGSGKSRLVQALVGEARGRGWRTLEGRCVSYGSRLAYVPYADAVRDAAGLGDEDDDSAALAQLTAALAVAGAQDAAPLFARLLGLSPPERLGAAAELEPEAFRRELHAAFVAWVARLAEDGPAVLVVEDVHWIDPSSAALTRELAEACAERRVLLVLTGRPEADELLAAGPSRTALRLSRLDEPALDELVEAALDGPAPSTLLRAVRARAEGNPFFALELVRSLQDGGVLQRVGDGWRLAPEWDAAAVPQTVEALVAARIDLLPPSAVATLKASSVIGRRIDLALLETVHDAAEVADAIPVLVQRGLLDRDADDELVFHHALTQEVAYGRLLRRERRRLHLAVAAAAEARYGSGDDTIGLLARHVYLGGAGPRALDYLLRAGQRARSLYANSEAIEHLRAAAEVAQEHTETADRLPDVLLDLAEVHGVMGAFDAASDLYVRVRDLRPGDLLAWQGIAATLRKRGRYADALAVLDLAVAAVEDSAAATVTLALERAWTLSLLGRYAETITVARDALQESRPAPDGVVGRLLLQLTNAERLTGAVDAALAHGQQAVGVFERNGELAGLAVAHRRVADLLRATGRFDEAARSITDGVAIAERIGDAEEIAAGLLDLGALELDQGRLAEAVAHTRRAVREFERIDLASGRVVGYANLAEMLADHGQDAEAAEAGRRALELGRAIGRSLSVADALRTLGIVEARRGADEQAVASAEEAAALFVGMDMPADAADALDRVAAALREHGNAEPARALAARAGALG